MPSLERSENTRKYWRSLNELEQTPEFQALLGYTMGSYALGYFSPPTAPGENPEVVPPEFLFNGKVSGWGDDLYESVTARAKEGGR